MIKRLSPQPTAPRDCKLTGKALISKLPPRRVGFGIDHVKVSKFVEERIV
jgi:hypothetical protein